MRRYRIVVSRIYRIGLAGGAGSVPVLQAMITGKVVHWNPWTAVWVAAAVGATTVADNVGALVHKFRAHERAAARSRMHTPLVGALDAIREVTGVPLSALGISVFALRRGFLSPRRKLKRVFRFRLGKYPPPSKVDWTLGKGVIGECWRTGTALVVDRRVAAAWYGRHGRYGLPTSEARFRSVPPEVQSKFSFTRSSSKQLISTARSLRYPSRISTAVS